MQNGHCRLKSMCHTVVSLNKHFLEGGQDTKLWLYKLWLRNYINFHYFCVFTGFLHTYVLTNLWKFNSLKITNQTAYVYIVALNATDIKSGLPWQPTVKHSQHPEGLNQQVLHCKTASYATLLSTACAPYSEIHTCLFSKL